MKNTIKLFFLGAFLFGTTITIAQITTATGGATNVLPNSPTTNTNVGIGTNTPTEKLHVVGNIKASGLATFASTVTATRLISNVANGTSPLTVTSTTVVPNLNADLLDGLHATSFQTALINPITGLLTSGYFPKATGTNTLGNSILLDNTSHIVLQTAGTPYLKITNGTGFVNIGVDTATGNSTFYNSGTYHKFLINALGYDAMRINSTGNVLIGTSVDDGVNKLQVSGSLVASTVAATRLISNVATGTSPLTVTSTTVVPNLNADLLDGLHATSFQTALTNPITGIGTIGVISQFYSSGTIGNSTLSQSADRVLIGASDNGVDKLQVSGNISIPFGTAYKMYDIAGTGWGQMLYNNTYDRIDFNRGIQALALTLTTAPTTSAGTYDILTRNTSTGALESKASTFFATSANNIYTNDGTLSGARTVTMGANPITFSGTGNYIINAGKMGIGTSTPDAKLTVNGAVKAYSFDNNSGISISASGTDRPTIGFHVSDNSKRFKIELNGINTTAERIGIWSSVGQAEPILETISFLKNGDVGIGTATPQAKLDVEGGDFYLGESVSTNGNRREFRVYGFDSGSKFYGSAHANFDDDKRTFDISTSSQTEQLKIDASLNTNGFISLLPGASAGVGIGTLTTGSHKLAVEGTIGAREVKVYLGAWSDFVFKKDYSLPSLLEVETHIKGKGHLKDIPSEKEVLQKGLNLGEMNSKLLQKVEELTLYLIQQNKDIGELKAQVKALLVKKQ